MDHDLDLQEGMLVIRQQISKSHNGPTTRWDPTIGYKHGRISDEVGTVGIMSCPADTARVVADS